MLMLAGCDHNSPNDTTADPHEAFDVTADPSEAFSPHVTLELNQTRTWGGFKIRLEKVFATGGAARDIRLEAQVVYTNLGSESVTLPTEVRFELDGKVFPADPAGDANYRLPGRGFADESITGTLVDAAEDDWPSPDEMRKVLGRVKMVYGAAGKEQAIFPFTEH